MEKALLALSLILVLSGGHIMKFLDLTKRYTRLTLSFLPAIILCSLPLTAQAEDDDKALFIPSNSAGKNFYGGIGVGYGDNDYPGSNQDGSVSGTSRDRHDTVTDFYVGYQFNDRVSVQAGHTDLGNSDFKGTSSGGPSWSAGPVSAKHDADGWELGVMGRWPVAPRWYALGYVGWMWWESKETFVEASGTTVVKESGSDVTYAIGFEFDHGLKDRIVYRFMGSHHEVGDFGYDVNTATAEIVYRFP